MSIIELIVKKRDGGTYTEAEIYRLVQLICDARTPDYQISALLMAIYLRGMNEWEVSYLTRAMAETGETISFPSAEGLVVDKHSTGGVGDKTTLVLMPLIAATGLKVAKLSGRGLGHTGGTLDKLSVFEGYQYDLSREEIIRAVHQNGIVLSGQTGRLVPADQRMYALRDSTGTVDSLPLIASSIMSKKIAGGAKAILLDVKVGNGAIFEDSGKARELASSLVSVGQHLQIPIRAVLTDMSAPLGYAVGNALEVGEAIETLRGEGPVRFRELCIQLGIRLMMMTGRTPSKQAAEDLLNKTLDSGEALEKLRSIIENQGGNSRYLDHPEDLPRAAFQKTLTSPESGFIVSIHARKIGMASMYSGAGRTSKEQKVDLGAGIYLHQDRGNPVSKGDPLLTIYAASPEKMDQALQIASSAITIADEAPKPTPLILGEI